MNTGLPAYCAGPSISKSENLSAQRADVALTTHMCVGALARPIWATGVHPRVILAIPRDIGAGSGANAHLRGGGPIGHGYRAIQQCPAVNIVRSRNEWVGTEYRL